MQRTDVCGEVERAAAAAGTPASALEIEITETAVLADPVRAVDVTACLRSLGAIMVGVTHIARPLPPDECVGFLLGASDGLVM